MVRDCRNGCCYDETVEGDEEACEVDRDHDNVDSSLRWVFMLCLLRGWWWLSLLGQRSGSVLMRVAVLWRCIR